MNGIHNVGCLYWGTGPSRPLLVSPALWCLVAKQPGPNDAGGWRLLELFAGIEAGVRRGKMLESGTGSLSTLALYHVSCWLCEEKLRSLQLTNSSLTAPLLKLTF